MEAVEARCNVLVSWGWQTILVIRINGGQVSRSNRDDLEMQQLSPFWSAREASAVLMLYRTPS